VLLLRDVFTRDMSKAWHSFNVAIGVAVVWSITAIAVVSTGCPPESYLDNGLSGLCPTQVSSLL
jgi:hypothetical protein